MLEISTSEWVFFLFVLVFQKFVQVQEKSDVIGILNIGARKSDFIGVLNIGARKSDVIGVLNIGARISDVIGVLSIGVRISDCYWCFEYWCKRK